MFRLIDNHPCRFQIRSSLVIAMPLPIAITGDPLIDHAKPAG
jgi:hypothetical protein